MLKKETLQTAATVLIGFGIASLIVGSSQTFQSCIGEHYHHEPSETLQKGFAQFLIMFKVSLGCSGEFVHKNAESIIALFTVILGIATWLLWRATKRLVEGAEDTAKRQLRAYVSGDPSGVDNWGPNIPFEISYILKNTGQTFASNVRHFTWGGIHPWPLPVGEKFPTGGEATDGARTVIFPNQTLTGHAFFKDGLTAKDIADLEVGHERLYLFCRIQYDDIFGAPHNTKFCAAIGGPKFVEMVQRAAAGRGSSIGGIFEYSHLHNEAD
jgi:hypothetical protein